MNLTDLRKHYTLKSLDELDVYPDAIDQFNTWMQEAIDSEVPEANAMTLSTVTPDGKPTSRVVLLKGVENGTFVFFTNYLSEKANQIELNPYVALNFLWHSLERQVRITGLAVKISNDASEAYFKMRPRGSQIGAWASAQSSIIPNRDCLEKLFAETEGRFEGQEVPKPPHWGGYAVSPAEIEFWQGRHSRLHDRIRYTAKALGGWQIDRLAP